MDILRDFSTKMLMKEVTGVQDYYEKAQRVSTDLSSRAGKVLRPLTNIENLEKAKKVELPPLVPMLDHLKEYVEKNEIPKLENGLELINVIGGPNKQYYAACYEIVRVMLLAKNDKRRCVIFHGIADTGKSWIAKIMNRIFDSHMKQETKGMFDEKISDVEAHRQLLILNEANMYDLFRRKNMAIMKKLTEGDGCPLENK